MSSQLQVTGEAKIRDIQGPVVANSGVITALDGAANQYVRGDGTLASFPTSGGGGSSVSYYLNGSVNQGTFGGSTYYQMSKNAIVGTGTNFSTSSDGLLAQFITDANDPDVVSIPSGNWNVEFFMNVSASSGALASFYVEIYKYDGSTFTLLATNVATPEQLTNTTTVDAYFTSVAMPLSAMALTDRLAVRIFANVASKTVTLYTEDNRLCQVVTTFSKGILSINNLTDQSQNLTTGTSGTNFAIVSSGDTHTFNLPIASASNTGKLSSTDWSTFNGKVPYTGATANVDLGNFNFDANEISGGAIIAKLNGPASSPFILKSGSSGYVIGDDAISLVSSPTTANTLILASNIGVVTKTAQIGLGSLSATRTFTLPDASGTIALTSNLSSYVPYTGATADVDLGVNFLKARTFYAEGNGGGGSYAIKNGATPSFEDGYTILSSNDYRLNILSTVSSVTKAVYLGFSGVTATRTFTFPDLSGTLALLEGTQTFSGSKTFSNLLIGERGIVLSAGTTTFVAGSTSLNGNANGLTIALGVTVGGTTTSYAHQLLFPQITPRTYTFPAASGTVALTSDLSAYLPLTGGTLTGALIGTTALFNGSVDVLNGNINISNSYYLTARNNANNTFLRLIGRNPSDKVVIDPDGYGTIFTGALSGTSATFSSSVGVGGATSTNGVLEVLKASGALAQFSVGWNTSNHTDFFVDVSGNFYVQPQGTTRMTITSGGNVGIGTSSPSTKLHINTTATAENVLKITNSTLDLTLGVNTDSGGSFLFENSNNALRFGTNATERMRITSGGNVGIGTSSPTQKLSIVGSYVRSHSLSEDNTNAGVYFQVKNGASTVGQSSQFVDNSGNWIIYTGTSSESERMRITSGGMVGIGMTGYSNTRLTTRGADTSSSNWAFFAEDVNGATIFGARNDQQVFAGGIAAGTGTTLVLTSGGYINKQSSSIRYKKDVQPIDIGLDFIMTLNPVSYLLKDGDVPQVGFIAEDFPEDRLVSMSMIDNKDESKGYQKESINYAQIAAPLVKAIQEQTQIIKDLEARILSLESK